MTTTLSTHGQVVLPPAARRKLGLQPGARFVCAVRDGGIFLKPKPGKSVKFRIGRSKHSRLPALVAPAGTPPLTSEAVRTMLADSP
ncbi:MAG: AbrB/MazE/SpoVT family DNA-binding domain-containing protein [Opitutaceae bacterium]|nr:AbrB/MazE/SpoVT family DNA-binding domain-containing protein [Opitutaceae bacterium]